MVHTGIQIPTLHEMGRETLNPHIGTVTSNSDLQIVFMPPISKKLRRHIGLGLSVHLSVRNTFWQLRNSRTPYARILKFYIWHVHEK